MSGLRVLISGAGLGGLCLAQALRGAGVDVQVFERDHSPWDRPQGYRLHMDSDGVGALADALPPALFALFEATAMRAEPFTTLLDTSLVERHRARDEERGEDDPALAPSRVTRTGHHVNVNRATVRQILLAGLDDVVHFGAALTGYESDATGVTAHLADGSSARGDLLVGADGILSPVRRQRVPAATTVDSGIRAIYGRVPLPAALEVVPARAREDIFSVAVDADRRFLGLGPVLFPTPPQAAAAALAPWARLDAQDDYVVCLVGGRRELFDALPADVAVADLRRAGSAELQQIAVRSLDGWSDAARAIPAHGDPGSFFFVEMYTSVPADYPPPTNVTLLGDAVHAMTPMLGRGANLALRDAARLARALGPVAQGGAALADALAAYEAEMTAYGFDVVRRSATTGARLVGQNPLPA